MVNKFLKGDDFILPCDFGVLFCLLLLAFCCICGDSEAFAITTPDIKHCPVIFFCQIGWWLIKSAFASLFHFLGSEILALNSPSTRNELCDRCALWCVRCLPILFKSSCQSVWSDLKPHVHPVFCWLDLKQWSHDSVPGLYHVAQFQKEVFVTGSLIW